MLECGHRGLGHVVADLAAASVAIAVRVANATTWRERRQPPGRRVPPRVPGQSVETAAVGGIGYALSVWLVVI